MRLILHSLLAVSLVAPLVGCSRKSDIHRGYDSESGDLGAFILRVAPKYGVRLLTTNALSAIPAKWHFRGGSNEFSVVVEGDCFQQLHTFLNSTVGALPGSMTTNRTGELPRITAYYGTNAGVTVSCSWGKDSDGKQHTGFVILNYGAGIDATGTFSAAQYTQLFHKVLSELLENPLKEFECHDEAVKHAGEILTFPKEVEALFGASNVDHFIRPFTGAAVWNSAAYFAGRYTLELRVPIEIDYEHCRVKEALGPAEVEIDEVTKVEFYGSGSPGARLEGGHWRLTENEWRSLVQNGGDWSVVNIAIVSNAPVKDFEAYANSLRDPIRYRMEHYDKPVREAFDLLRTRGAKTNLSSGPEMQKQ